MLVVIAILYLQMTQMHTRIVSTDNQSLHSTLENTIIQIILKMSVTS